MEKYNDIYARPIAVNMVEDNEKIWMALFDRNGICEIDKKTRKARICKIFTEELLNGEQLYCSVEKVGNYLIFSPGMAEKIAVYDLAYDSMIYIPLNRVEHHCKQSQEEIKFWNVFRYQSSVYLLGYSYPAIIKINMKSAEIIYITDWVEEVEKNVKEGDVGGYFADGHVIIGDLALISISYMNALLELNLKTDSTRIIRINASIGGVGGISSADGQNIWLVGKRSNTNKVYCWNMKIDKMREYCLVDEDEGIFDPFYAPVCTSSKVYFMPISASNIYEFNLNTKKVEKNETLGILLEKMKNLKWPRWKTIAPRIQGNLLIFLSCDDLKWYEYNMVTGETQNYVVQIEENEEDMKLYFDTIYTKAREDNLALSERKIPLEYIIDKTMSEEKQKLCNMNTNLLTGRGIYERVCKES